jgi:hypothetical protein
MSTSATLESLNVDDITADATAFFEISTADAKNVFRYSADANADANADSDMIFYVKMDSWPVDISNICHAQLSENSVYSSAAADRNLVTHDYIRYLALKLFNTHLGVDLFNNETDMRSSLYSSGKTKWEAVSALLSAANGKTNSDTGNDNISRRLYLQLIDQDISRFNALQEEDANGTRALPFVNGDIIEFKLSIDAAADQHLLTNVSAIPTHSYKIELRIKDTPSNTLANDDESGSGSGSGGGSGGGSYTNTVTVPYTSGTMSDITEIFYAADVDANAKVAVYYDNTALMINSNGAISGTQTGTMSYTSVNGDSGSFVVSDWNGPYAINTNDTYTFTYSTNGYTFEVTSTNTDITISYN